MKDFKGTQGDWEAKRNAAYWEVTNRDNDQVLAIAIHNFDYRDNGLQLDDNEKAEANAKLIAAAPELLANLQRIIERIKECEYQDSFPSAFRRAEAAINKAL